MSRHLCELFLPPHYEGVRIGQARYGSVFDHFDFARLRGRIYVRACFVEGIADLQRREAAAENAIRSKLWRQDSEAWPQLRDLFCERLLQYARRDPAIMDCETLLQTIRELRTMLIEGTIQHFVQQPASRVPVGDWLRQTCGCTGAPISEVISVLQSCRSESHDYFQAIDDFVKVIRRCPAAASLFEDQSEHPKARLQRLRDLSPEIQKHLDLYVDEYADRIITGFDITDATLRELPGFMLSIIASRLDASETRSARLSKLHDAHRRLREADRLAMLYNWPKAAPLYAEAESLFAQSGDKRNALFAKLGYLWVTADAGVNPNFRHALGIRK